MPPKKKSAKPSKAVLKARAAAKQRRVDARKRLMDYHQSRRSLDHDWNANWQPDEDDIRLEIGRHSLGIPTQYTVTTSHQPSPRTMQANRQAISTCP